MPMKAVSIAVPEHSHLLFAACDHCHAPSPDRSQSLSSPFRFQGYIGYQPPAVA